VGQRVNAPPDALPLSRNDAALIAQRDALIAALQVQNAMLARTVSGLEPHASPHFGEAAFDGKESNDMMMLGGKNRRT
jgi:hypothetical protein